jgi:hypothetical protein
MIIVKLLSATLAIMCVVGFLILLLFQKNRLRVENRLFKEILYNLQAEKVYAIVVDGKEVFCEKAKFDDVLPQYAESVGLSVKQVERGWNKDGRSVAFVTKKEEQ